MKKLWLSHTQASGTITAKMRLELGYADGANNGNVASQSIFVGGNLVATQNYVYDAVNRSTVAEEAPGNENAPVCDSHTGQGSAGRWCQKHGYDRWGNRLFAAKFGVGQGASTLEPTAVSSANNQVTGTNWHYGQILLSRRPNFVRRAQRFESLTLCRSFPI